MQSSYNVDAVEPLGRQGELLQPLQSSLSWRLSFHSSLLPEDNPDVATIIQNMPKILLPRFFLFIYDLSRSIEEEQSKIASNE